MLLQDRPFLVIRAARLVEDRGWDLEFADVMHQPGPMQSVQVGFGQVQFFTDHQRVGANAFGVATGHPIVGVQRSRQCHQPFRRFLKVVVVELAGFQ